MHGYQTLLAARFRGRQGGPGATLLYSGTPGRAEGYRIPFSMRDLHRVLELRNALALVHATGRVPPPPSARQVRALHAAAGLPARLGVARLAAARTARRARAD